MLMLISGSKISRAMEAVRSFGLARQLETPSVQLTKASFTRAVRSHPFTTARIVYPAEAPADIVPVFQITGAPGVRDGGRL